MAATQFWLSSAGWQIPNPQSPGPLRDGLLLDFGSLICRVTLEPMTSDHELLRAALVGYQSQVDQIRARMAEIRHQLGTGPELVSVAEPKRRVMSAAGRRRIAAAQRKRWAEQKVAKPAPERTKKRRMSAAGRKRIAKATRKRWAAYRAKKAAGQKAAVKPQVPAAKRHAA